MDDFNDALIVLINYGNEQEIVKYVRQIERIKNSCNVRIVVVNNKCSKPPECNLDETLSNYNFVEKIDANTNLGYMNGFLYGLDYFYNKYGYLPWWLIISNSDIQYEQTNFFEMLLAKKYDESIWCVGPQVRDLSGVYCNPHYKERIPLKKIKQIRLFMGHAPLCKLYYWFSRQKYAKKKRNNIRQDSCYVYSVHGCYMILRNDFYFALHGERFGALLYSEESFVAEIARLNNKKVYYDADLEVVHTENVATSKLRMSKKGKAIAESLKYIQNRFYDKK